MYVFPDTKLTTKIEIENGSLIQSTDTYKKVSKKQDTPATFYVLKESKNGDLSIDNVKYQIKKAEYHFFETIIESERKETKEDNIESLIAAFGNKRSKEIYKERKNRVQAMKNDKVYFFEEQILPAFNANAEKPEDIYKLEDLFTEEIVVKFKTIEYKKEDLHELIRLYDINKFHVHLLLMDCILKAMEKKKLNPNHLSKSFIGGCAVFQDFLEDFMMNRSFTDIGRDKMAILFYILLLMVNNYNAHFDTFPKFRFESDKVILILKKIGCIYHDKTKVVSLVNKPVTEVEFKKRKIR